MTKTNTELRAIGLRTTEADLCKWIGNAAAGASLEYHRGFLCRDLSRGSGCLCERDRVELRGVAHRIRWAAGRGLSYDGRTVEYRGAAEISHAITELEREIAVIEGKSPVRQIRVFTSKGL